MRVNLLFIETMTPGLCSTEKLIFSLSLCLYVPHFARWPVAIIISTIYIYRMGAVTEEKKMTPLRRHSSTYNVFAFYMFMSKKKLQLCTRPSLGEEYQGKRNDRGLTVIVKANDPCSDDT